MEALWRQSRTRQLLGQGRARRAGPLEFRAFHADSLFMAATLWLLGALPRRLARHFLLALDSS